MTIFFFGGDECIGKSAWFQIQLNADRWHDQRSVGLLYRKLSYEA